MNKIALGMTAMCLSLVACGPGTGEPLPTSSSSSSSSGASGSTSSGGSSGGVMCPEVLCTLYCEDGFRAGPDGCPTCQCGGSSSGGTSGSTSSSGGIVCPAIACANVCPFGFQAGADGCPTCGCLPSGSCDEINDVNLCNRTPGCVGVYFEEGQSGAPRQDDNDPTTPPVDGGGFICCAQSPGGIFCGSEPPPPVGCWSDDQCGAGFVCDTVNYCNSACDTQDAGLDCPAVCLGQCVPRNACWGAWLDQNGTCRAPNDGVYPQGCCQPEETLCFSDNECGAGQHCDTTQCLSPCRDGEACPPVCYGRCTTGEPPACAAILCAPGYQCVACGPNEDCVARCEPVNTDCRNTGCLDNQECVQVSACAQCDCPPDASSCYCPPCLPQYQCVDVGGDCRSTGCGEGFSCQAMTACPDIACDCGDAGLCDCVPPPCSQSWQCLPVPDQCAVVRCEAGTVCQACGPNEDCIVKCQPINTGDCRDNGCGPNEECTPLVCAAVCFCDPASDAGCECPPCPEAWMCVPTTTGDCRTDGCAPGATCEEVTYCSGGGFCGCPGNDPSCTCPPPPPDECFTSWQCNGQVDPCASLTEGQCMLDFDLCSPVYVTACPDCGPGGDCAGVCSQFYAGCVTISNGGVGGTGGGTPPSPGR